MGCAYSTLWFHDINASTCLSGAHTPSMPLPFCNLEQPDICHPAGYPKLPCTHAGLTKCHVILTCSHSCSLPWQIPTADATSTRYGLCCVYKAQVQCICRSSVTLAPQYGVCSIVVFGYCCSAFGHCRGYGMWHCETTCRCFGFINTMQRQSTSRHAPRPFASSTRCRALPT